VTGGFDKAMTRDMNDAELAELAELDRSVDAAAAEVHTFLS